MSIFTSVAWHDPGVQASVIASIGTIGAAMIAAICAAVIGKRFDNRKKLQEKLVIATGDIAFLLAVEEKHCEIHKVDSEKSYKATVRKEVVERGFVWSGRFTPGRVANPKPESLWRGSHG